MVLLDGRQPFMPLIQYSASAVEAETTEALGPGSFSSQRCNVRYR
jgi:hypothetical protein